VTLTHETAILDFENSRPRKKFKSPNIFQFKGVLELSFNRVDVINIGTNNNKIININKKSNKISVNTFDNA